MFVLKSLIMLEIQLKMAQEIVSIWLEMSILKSAIQNMTHAQALCLPIGTLMVAKNSGSPENVINCAKPHLMEIHIVLKVHLQFSNLKIVMVFAPKMAAITIQMLSMLIEN